MAGPTLDTSIVDPNAPAGKITPAAPGWLETTYRFTDMRAAMLLDGTKHDWFGNRAGAQEEFSKLQMAVSTTDPAKLKELGYTNEDLSKLRGLMGADKYDPKSVEAEVKALVGARIPGVPQGNYDSDALAKIIQDDAAAQAGKKPAAIPMPQPRPGT
jgi:hypothetical protein